jgi:hypothetical protein
MKCACAGAVLLDQFCEGGHLRIRNGCLSDDITGKSMANINPALKELETLVGDWEMELSNASFLPDPSTVIRGIVSFEWFDGGDFLIMRQGNKINPPYAIWFIGRDESASDYTALYIDDRRVSRVYEMSFEKGIWKLCRTVPNFSQRFEGKMSRDRNTITAYWEKSVDGKKWEHDFDVMYTRRRLSVANS